MLLLGSYLCTIWNSNLLVQWLESRLIGGGMRGLIDAKFRILIGTDRRKNELLFIPTVSLKAKYYYYGLIEKSFLCCNL